jgi:hypothetical protein
VKFRSTPSASSWAALSQSVRWAAAVVATAVLAWSPVAHAERVHCATVGGFCDAPAGAMIH